VPTDPIVFLFDVDNTVLDNDRFAAALGANIDEVPGGDLRRRYRDLFSKLREDVGYADYLGAMQLQRSVLGNYSTTNAWSFAP